MNDKRSAASADPALDPLLERLAFLETANDGLKSRLSAGSFGVELQSLALRDQLESARAEIERQKEALDGFCRETLAAGQARDQAQFIAQETVKALDAAVQARDAVAQDRDALRLRLETLEGELRAAHRVELEEAQARLESQRKSFEAALAELAERESLLVKTAEKDRRLIADLESELARARRGAQEAADAHLQARQTGQAEEAERMRKLASDFSEREAVFALAAEKDRRLIGALEHEVERLRRDAQETARAVHESSLAAQAAAEERLRGLEKEFAAHEARLNKKAAEDRRLLEEMLALEAAAKRAAERERALRELAGRPPAEAQTPLPVEGLVDPVWAKVVPTLRRSVGAAFARLRQLPLGAIPEGPRAMIRFAAVSLTETSDMLKALEEYFNEDGTPPAPGRAEAAVEAALAAWEGPFRQRRIVIARRVEMGLPQVLLGEEPFRVAVFQILRNAYDAMPRGGTLTVQISRDAASGGVRVRFSDTGPGFTEKAAAGLFSPFANPRPGHLGLGLGLARRVARRFGGDVEAGNNIPARGAFVSMLLAPADPPPGGEMES